MNDIRKILDMLNETTTAGAVSTVAQPMTTERREDYTAENTEQPANPQVLEYGNWENSALASGKKLKAARKKASKIVKSVYGESTDSEVASDKKIVAEGSDYQEPKLGTIKANLMNTTTPTVQVQVFKHNTLRGDNYWVTKEVRKFKTMDLAKAYIDRINKQGVAETNVSKYKDLGATKDTAVFVKNMTTGKIVSPHRSTQDAKDAIIGYQRNDDDVYKIVRARKEGVAEGSSKQFEIIYRGQNGDRKRKIVSGTSKEAVARQFKKQYKLEIEQVKQLQQGVAEGASENAWNSGISDEDFINKFGRSEFNRLTKKYGVSSIPVPDLVGYRAKEPTDPKVRLHRGLDGPGAKLKSIIKQQGVAEGSEQVYKVLAVTKSDVLSKKVMLKVKANSLDEVFERLAINDWYPLEINGIEVINGKRLKQGVAEGSDENMKLKAESGDVKVFFGPVDSEGAIVSVRRNGKEIASGDYDRHAGKIWIGHDAYDSSAELAAHYAEQD